MAVTYFIAVTLALFAGALPAQILGVIWASIQESMTVEIPYIALLRLLGCAGAIAAVILSERIRGYILARDLIVGAIALEALSLIGFSLSREFWNLCVWITALGFSAGLCLALISYLIRGTWQQKASLLFAFSPMGAAAGACLTRYILSAGRSWRAACQGLSIAQIVLCMSVFFLRRTLLRDVAAILKKQRRRMEMHRQKRREELIREKGEVDARLEQTFLVRLLLLYTAAVFCALVLLCAIHLTYRVQAVENPLSANLVRNIVYVCGGMAAGRIACSFLRARAKQVCWLGLLLTFAPLLIAAAFIWTGHDAEGIRLLTVIGTGFGAGMIYPALIRLDDERLDDDAQTKMTGLIPAFYLGADAMITPFVQTMSQSFGMARCIGVMLALTCCLGICLIFASVRLGKR